MASVCSRGLLRPRPALCPSSPRSPLRPLRHFSSSQPRNNPALDVVISGPNALFDTIHSLGLPWWAAISVTAAAVRCIIVYPFSLLPLRENTRIRAQVTPFVYAKARLQRLQLANEKPAPGDPQARRDRAILKSFWSTMKVSRQAFRVSRTLGAGPSWSRYALNFGVLGLFSEALRQKCGTPGGWVSLATEGAEFVTLYGQKLLSGVGAELAPSAASRQAERLAERLQEEFERNGTLIEGSGFDEARLQALMEELRRAPDTTAVFFDPSLQTGGLPDYFLDLTLPYPGLSLALGLTVFTAAVFRPRRRVGGGVLGFVSGKGLGIIAATFFGLVSMRVPSAVLLYWISSIGTGYLQSRYLDFRHPIPTAIQPCEKPIRHKVRQKFL